MVFACSLCQKRNLSVTTPPPSPTPIGRVVREYSPPKWESVVVILAAVICLVLLVSPIDYAIPIGDILWDFNIWVRFLLGLGVLYFAAYFYYRRGLTYVLHEGGFTRTQMSNTLTVRWGDIKNVSIVVSQERLIGSIPMPGTKARTYNITLNSRKIIAFGEGGFQGAREFGQEVIRQWQTAVKAAAPNTPS